jgi:hypothetical protein
MASPPTGRRTADSPPRPTHLSRGQLVREPTACHLFMGGEVILMIVPCIFHL